MDCELCRTTGQSGGATRCQRCGFDTTLPPDVKRFLVSLIGFRPGELLEGRYRIDRILGYGGMSVVYKAHDDVLGEDVAIKVINRGRAGDDNKLFTDIRRDIVTTRKLAHPDIVKIYDFHKTDTCGFLTMEFVPCNDLASLISEKGNLDEGEVCRIAEQVAEALQYAHANGVIHCDIKPGNLLLTESGRVKIADFGISRLMQEENSGLTGLVVGTPAYMAPEQIRGERPGPRTDMYALGIVMWQCLMGAPPFTKGDIAYQHVHVPLPPMPGVSPDVERIVRRAAAKSMDDRYPSMAVMVQELHEVLQRMSLVVDATVVQAPPPGSAATIVLTPPPSARVAAQAPPAEPATVAQTPPPRPVQTVAQTTPVAQAGTAAQTIPAAPGTVAQSPRAAPAGTVVQTPPPAQAGTVDQAPPPPAPPKQEQAPPSQPAPSSKKWLAIAAAAVMIFGGAAVWALFHPSQSDKPNQQQLASVQVLPGPATVTPTIPVTSVRPASPVLPASTKETVQQQQAGPLAKQVEQLRQAQKAQQAEQARLTQQAEQVRQAQQAQQAEQARLAQQADQVRQAQQAVSAQSAQQAEQVRLAQQAEQVRLAQQAQQVEQARLVQQAEQLRVAQQGQQAEQARLAQQAEQLRLSQQAQQEQQAAQTRLAEQARITEQAKQADLAKQAEAARQADAARQVDAARQAEAARQADAARQAVATRQAEAVKPIEAARPVEVAKPAKRDLGPPIQLSALPRGRWCDINVRAVGTGLPMASARSDAERRLTGERSAELDAYRRIAENVKGIQVSGGSTVKDFVTSDASYKTKVDAVIRGARRVDSQKNDDGTWSVVMELNLAGMCDVIQAGTP